MTLFAVFNNDQTVSLHAEKPVYNERLGSFISSFGEIVLPKLKQRALLKAIPLNESNNIAQFNIGELEFLGKA